MRVALLAGAVMLASPAHAMGVATFLEQMEPVQKMGRRAKFSRRAKALMTEPSDALGFLAVRLFGTGISSALLFFSGFCALIGVMILRARLAPRAIGYAMTVAGFCYVVNTLAGILAPDFAKQLSPWISAGAFVGELSLALWLLIAGGTHRGSQTPAVAPRV